VKEYNLFIKSFLFVSFVLISGCGSNKNQSSEDPAPVVTYPMDVAWTANKEMEINSAGGGYRVYYSTATPVSISGANYVDVPFATGAAAPTSVRLRLPAGSYYLRVAAYSSFNPDGLAEGNLSAGSSEVTVTVP